MSDLSLRMNKSLPVLGQPITILVSKPLETTFIVEMPNRSSVVVDATNRPIKTIEQVLETIKPNTTVYLAEGVYTIKTPIFVPGLVFEKKDPEKPVYIVGSDGPVVNVVLNSGEFVMFKKIIFMHTGVMVANKFIENAPNEP